MGNIDDVDRRNRKVLTEAIRNKLCDMARGDMLVMDINDRLTQVRFTMAASDLRFYSITVSKCV